MQMRSYALRERERDAGHEREDVAAENLRTGDRDVRPPVVVRLEQRVERRRRRGHDEFRHLAVAHEEVPRREQRQVRCDRERPASELRVHVSHLSRFARTKASSARSACSRYTRSISCDCPGESVSFGSRHQVPSSSPCCRSTSWHPGMQPAKLLATSKNALLQSVILESSASSASSTGCAWIRFIRETAVLVHTLQWPSSPPRMRTRIFCPSRGTSNGTARSSTIWSSLPV